MNVLAPSHSLFVLLAIVCSFGLSKGDTKRRYSTNYVNFDKNQSIDSIVDASYQSGQILQSFESDIANFYSTLSNEELLPAFDHTLHYLSRVKDANKNTPDAFEDRFFYDAIADVIDGLIIYAENIGVLDEDFQSELSTILMENFITDPIGFQLFPNVADNISNLSSIYIESVASTDNQDAVDEAITSFLHSVISLYQNDNPNNINYTSSNFTPGIEPVAKTDAQETPSMMFGGVEGFYNFDPQKSNLFATATKSFSDFYFNKYFPDTTNADSNSSLSLLESFSSSVFTSLSKTADEIGRTGNESFIYELIKQSSAEITSGSTSYFFSNNSFSETGLSFEITEQLTYSLSKKSIETLSAGNNNQLDFNKIAEAVAFGSSMGAQNEQSLNSISGFTTNMANTRKLLSQAVAFGNAQGSLVALSELSLTEQDIGWDEIKELASHSAKGTMIGNVANAIYFGDEKDLLPIINFSAQGSTFGSTSTLELNNVEKPLGKIEDLSVEVARSSAHGASLGATFSAVGLKGSDPINKENDSVSNDAVKAVAYGSTIGSILGAAASGNGDPVVVQQAAKQGVTEGSMIGSGFATVYQEDFFVDNDYEDMQIAAKKNLITTINSMNADASIEAMNSLATKKVKTSSRDMLLLIRKFNISPNTTNPATIFQRPNKKQTGNDFPFDDKFPAASPI